MVGFCLPHFIRKTACDRFLIGNGGDIVVLGPAVGKLCGLATRELLE
jgi:hypothetical protein